MIKEGTHQSAAVYRTRIEQLQKSAAECAGTMQLIAHRLQEVLDKGGSASIAPQMHFLTSTLMRMQKDLGVVEHLQANGAMLKGSGVNGYRRNTSGHTFQT